MFRFGWGVDAAHFDVCARRKLEALVNLGGLSLLRGGFVALNALNSIAAMIPAISVTVITSRAIIVLFLISASTIEHGKSKSNF